MVILLGIAAANLRRNHMQRIGSNDFDKRHSTATRHHSIHRLERLGYKVTVERLPNAAAKTDSRRNQKSSERGGPMIAGAAEASGS